MMYLFQVSVCTFIFYLLYHFLYKTKTNHVFNRGYLLVALMLSLLFPLLKIPVFPEYIDLSLVMKTTGVINGNQTAEPPLITWQNAILLIYILGVMVHFSILGYRLYQLYNMIKTSEKENDGDCTRVYTESEIPVSSFLSYLMIPIEKKETITDYELQHEKSHIRQKHSLDILFIEFFRLVLWFNPLVIFYKKRMVEVHEYLADQSTLRQLGKSAYEAFLIQQVSHKASSMLAHNFYSLFKNRINMMNSKAKTSTWQYLMILPMVGISLFLFSFKTYPVYTGNEENNLIENDSIPTQTETIDTVIIFDPKTKKETIRYVRTTEMTTSESSNKTAMPDTGIDTVIVFDPDTYTESIFIVNHATGKIDTIQ